MEQRTTHGATFTTPARHVFGEVLLVLVTAPVILFVGLVVAGMSAYAVSSRFTDDTVRESPVFGIAMASPIFALFCWFAWLWAKHRLKFTLRIGSSQLQFGKRPFRESLPCSSVETIRVMGEEPENPSTYRVELRGDGRKWVCFFGESTLPCVRELLPQCTNSVYVDLEGTEHLPGNTHQPARVIANLIRTRRRLAIGALLFSAILLGWSLAFLVAVALHASDGQSLSETLAGTPVGLAAIVFLGIASLISGCVQLYRMFRLSAKMRTAMRDTVLDEAVDLSSSDTNKM